MAVKIEKKIVSYQASNASDPAVATATASTAAAEQLPIALPDKIIPVGGATIVQMHEKALRPDRLVGSTYKIKPPVSDHAFYVTINDRVINPDTPYMKRRPFEIFINSKNMDHYQWISALTLIISAVFRKGGDVTFLVKELQNVFDPKGGYFKKGGKFVPSLVAEIGNAIETHMKKIGILKDDKLDVHQQQLIDAKRKEYEQQQAIKQGQVSMAEEENGFPAAATLCMKCSTKAAIMLDGCLTCLSCGDSKCN